MTISPRANALTFAERVHLPSSRLLLWEAPFWLLLAYASLVPAKVTIQREWFGVPINYGDLCIFCGGVFYGIAALFGLLLQRKSTIPFRAVWPTVLVVLYGLATLFAARLEPEDSRAMAFTLLLMLAAPMQAIGLTSFYNSAQVREFLNRFVVFLSVLSFIYAAESIFDLGLRSEEGRNLGVDFGIQRVRGPLYGPSTGYFLLLPALGWGLYDFFSSKGRRVRSILCISTILVALIGLGSRAALILLAAYLIALALLMKSLKKKVITVLLIVILGAGAATLIYGQADTQRLQTFEDNFRKQTHETIWTMVQEENLLTLLGGQGYGNLWAWYRRDTLRGERVAVGDNVILTSFGTSLYHSHSTILEAAAELGLPGLLWCCSIVWMLVRLPFARGGDTPWRAFTWALAISLLSFGFDLFLFKSARVNAIWWMFVVGAMRLEPRPAKEGR